MPCGSRQQQQILLAHRQLEGLKAHSETDISIAIKRILSTASEAIIALFKSVPPVREDRERCCEAEAASLKDVAEDNTDQEMKGAFGWLPSKKKQEDR
jgi:hypothetical protein